MSVVTNQSLLSLRDEARNTEHHNLRRPTIRLRHSQVNFVRAQIPQLDQHTEPYEGSKRHRSPMHVQPLSPSVHYQRAGDGIASEQEERIFANSNMGSILPVSKSHSRQRHSLDITSPSTLPEDDFFVDTVGSGAALDTGFMTPALCFSSHSTSGSDDEVVLFAGRGRARAQASSKLSSGVENIGDQKTRKTESVDYRIADHGRGNAVGDSKIPEVNPVTKGKVDYPATGQPLPAPDLVGAITALKTPVEEAIIWCASGRNSNLDEQISKGRNGRVKAKSSKSTRRNFAKEAEDATLADYIANVSEHDVSSSNENRAEEDARRSSLRHPDGRDTFTQSGWNRFSIDDFGDPSTSDETSGTIQAVLSKRERPSGLQYLIIWEGHTVEDARWVSYSSLGAQKSSEQIRIFESREQLFNQHNIESRKGSDYSDDDAMQLNETDDEIENLKDEEDILRRRISSITDEKVARLLAKQEELGMVSDELLLFDDGMNQDGSDCESSEARQRLYDQKGFNPVHRRHIRALDNLLDQHSDGEFDIMDHERSSLKRNSSRLQQLQLYENSDVQLEVAFSTTWHKDRLKKQAKKREREELRAQGLLGKNHMRKADLKAKYLEGMSMEEVRDEIRSFLLSENERYTLKCLT